MENFNKICRFLEDEARLLDEGKFEQWANLFVEDGYYWMPARTNQTDPYSEISIFFDDRALMKERIARLRHPRVHAQLPPSRTSRMIANVTVEKHEKSDGREEIDFLIRSKLLIGEFRPNIVPDEGNRRFFICTCWHLLRPNLTSYQICWKKVELIDADSALASISVYF